MAIDNLSYFGFWLLKLQFLHSHLFYWPQNLNAVKLNPGKLSLHWFCSSPLSLIFVISGFNSVNSASKQLVSPSFFSFGTKGGFTFPCQVKNVGDENIVWVEFWNSDLLEQVPVSVGKVGMLLHPQCSLLTAQSLTWILDMMKKKVFEKGWILGHVLKTRLQDQTLTRKALIRALLSVEYSCKGCGIELNVLRNRIWLFAALTICSGKTRGSFLISLNTSSPFALNGGRPVNMLKRRMPRAHLKTNDQYLCWWKQNVPVALV